MIYDTMLEYIRRELREVAAESRYKTAKGAGLRAECVKGLEQGKGSAETFASYLEYVCRTRPEFAYKLFYSLTMIICQEYGRQKEDNKR